MGKNRDKSRLHRPPIRLNSVHSYAAFICWLTEKAKLDVCSAVQQFADYGCWWFTNQRAANCQPVTLSMILVDCIFYTAAESRERENESVCWHARILSRFREKKPAGSNAFQSDCQKCFVGGRLPDGIRTVRLPANLCAICVRRGCIIHNNLK